MNNLTQPEVISVAEELVTLHARGMVARAQTNRYCGTCQRWANHWDYFSAPLILTDADGGAISPPALTVCGQCKTSHCPQEATVRDRVRYMRREARIYT